jgi:DNA-binding transcriptional ArsR family regulator
MPLTCHGKRRRSRLATWATTSRHLRILKEAGLVRVELDGREHIYKLDRDRLQAVAGTWMQRFIP